MEDRPTEYGMAAYPYHDEGPKPDPEAPETEPVYLTADQQIRAKALECAVYQMDNMGKDTPNKYADAFWSLVATFEAYIREGK